MYNKNPHRFLGGDSFVLLRTVNGIVVSHECAKERGEVIRDYFPNFYASNSSVRYVRPMRRFGADVQAEEP